MSDRWHNIQDDLEGTGDEDNDFIARVCVPDIEAGFEKLLDSHAGFDDYLREQEGLGSEDG